MHNGELEASQEYRPSFLPRLRTNRVSLQRGLGAAPHHPSEPSRCSASRSPSRGSVAASSLRACQNNYFCPDFHHLSGTGGEEGNGNVSRHASMKGWKQGSENLSRQNLNCLRGRRQPRLCIAPVCYIFVYYIFVLVMLKIFENSGLPPTDCPCLLKEKSGENFCPLHKNFLRISETGNLTCKNFTIRKTIIYFELLTELWSFLAEFITFLKLHWETLARYQTTLGSNYILKWKNVCNSSWPHIDFYLEVCHSFSSGENIDISYICIL